MAELANCSRCNAVFVKNIRTVCQNCYKEEEKAFETVYRFLRKQKNRETTVMEIGEATGVEELLIIKFVREKRLRPSQFPKLAYPCEKCGSHIRTGNLCQNCSNELKKDLEIHEQLEKSKEDRQENKQNIYYAFDEK
ncbi:hypothetical protein KFZ58_13130 [Virgibacillus sp. NKC19-16]|uniref:TIGR03826 family flagellar region protein n=1 Tax=Virgibacillus salidurans TaxID=2831673 RepID=UPI001F263CB9|nr:TIGR03826 family flagellar region protein [Virgibacillus sp. NKC19-16]UJL45347.1 hypothetical protein KFZ58_13130 [Virgibacillus sp. NKC19-16]